MILESPGLFCAFLQCWLRGGLDGQVQTLKSGCLLCSVALLLVSRKCLCNPPACMCFGFFKTSRKVELLLSGWLLKAESVAPLWGWRQYLASLSCLLGVLLLGAELLFLTSTLCRRQSHGGERAGVCASRAAAAQLLCHLRHFYFCWWES